jgi:hypothetical protein
VSRPRLVAAALALLLLLGSAGGAFYLWLWSPLATLDQRIGAATASLTAGALVLAVGAGVIALLAYRDAIRRPRLHLSVTATGGATALVTIALKNDGTASARNAVVWLDRQGTADLESQLAGTGWVQEPEGLLRWEASAGVAVHPKVPPLMLPQFALRRRNEPLRITHTFAADGFGPETGESLTDTPS